MLHSNDRSGSAILPPSVPIALNSNWRIFLLYVILKQHTVEYRLEKRQDLMELKLHYAMKLLPPLHARPMHCFSRHMCTDKNVFCIKEAAFILFGRAKGPKTVALHTGASWYRPTLANLCIVAFDFIRRRCLRLTCRSNSWEERDALQLVLEFTKLVPICAQDACKV